MASSPSGMPQPRSKLMYWALGVLITVIVAITAAAGAIYKWHHDRTQWYQVVIRELRQEFPLESMESRLPLIPRAPHEPPLSLNAIDQMLDAEHAISVDFSSAERQDMLQELHEGTVEEFVDREGVGVMRMVGSYARSVLANGYERDDGTWVGRNNTAIPQPEVVLPYPWDEAHALTESGRDPSSLLSLHYSNTLHFVHPDGFGAIRDRQSVIGFQPHQFNAIHEDESWQTMRLELVGLLLDEQPRVYETATLPRMQDVREVPTRALNAFEVAGLEHLRRGDQLFIRDVPNGVRMLGAVRSTQQCIECHGGDRGALLGAFSYALRAR